MITALRATTLLGEAVAAAPRASHAAFERAGYAILDTVGVTLVGSREPAARIVARTVQAPAGSRLIGTSLRAPAPDAALANGTSAHALDFDDVSPALVGHPSAVLVPALLAVGDEIGASGEAILDAYVVGFEVAARLGRALNPLHYNRGWHATATLGAPAAAAAVAHVLRLSRPQVQAAISIAGSLAGGMRVSFGSMVKPLHAGHAARTGVLAARLAEGGFDASAELFEAPRGFGDLFGEDVDWDRAFANWSWSEPEILSSGIQVKPYPSCAMTHTAIASMLSLRDSVSRVEQAKRSTWTIDRIECRVTPVTPQILIHSRPQTGLQAKFSMEYCLAVTLLDGQPGLAQFTDERVKQSDVQSLLRRVEIEADPTLVEDLTRGRSPVVVSIRLSNGQRLQATREIPPGSPEEPLTPAQLEQKFLSNATPLLGERRAVDAMTAFNRLQQADSVSRVLDCVCG